jgi:two-component system chemotaxis response regulator CheY
LWRAWGYCFDPGSAAGRGWLIVVDSVDPVLVVDDLNTMTRIVDGMLRKCGFTNVEQCHDGPTALQKLREKPFLFMMTDREMPGMNGLELVREIRADPKIRNVPIVIMSASSEAQHAEAAIAAGANFFMTKPFNLTTLKDVITQLLRPAQG